MSDELEKKESQTVEKTETMQAESGTEDVKPNAENKQDTENGGDSEPMETEDIKEAETKVNNGERVEEKKAVTKPEKMSVEKSGLDTEKSDASVEIESEPLSSTKSASKELEKEKEKLIIKELEKDKDNSVIKELQKDKEKSAMKEPVEKDKVTKELEKEKSVKKEVDKEKPSKRESEKDKEKLAIKEAEKDKEKPLKKKAETKPRTPVKSKSESDEEDMQTEVLKPGTLEQPVIQTGKRERKKVERLSATYTPPADKPIEVPEGRGTKLGDCPRVDHFMSRTHVDDLKPLHRFIFGKVGKETMIKKNLRLFNGFAFTANSAEYKKRRAKLMKYTLAVLKPICSALDLEKKGTRENIVDRILEFLIEPKDSGVDVPESKKKRKRSSTSEGDKPKKKRARKAAKNTDDGDDNDEESDSDDKSDEESNAEEEESEEEEKKPKRKSKPKKKPDPKKAAPRKKKDVTTSKKRQSNAPTDDDIKATVKEILDGANLEEVTMKTVCKQVYEKYPEHDLMDRKDFIKSTVKSLIS